MNLNLMDDEVEDIQGPNQIPQLKSELTKKYLEMKTPKVVPNQSLNTLLDIRKTRSRLRLNPGTMARRFS